MRTDCRRHSPHRLAGRRPHAAALAWSTLAAALALAGPAARADSSPYYLGAAQSFTHETNMLRLGDDQQPPVGYSRSDTVSTTSLQGGFDQPFGRQRAYADLTLRDNRYDANSIYDNRSYVASAGLDWSTVNRVSGSLTGSTSRSLASFNNYYGVSVLTSRDLRDDSNVDASLNVGLVTKYSLVVSGGHLRSRNSLDQPEVKALDFDQDRGSVGVQWNPTDVASVGLSLSRSVGLYPHFLETADGFQADRFKQDSIDLTTNLQPSGSSRIDARLSYDKTHYDLNSVRDFSGVTGTFGWHWQVHGRLTMTTRLIRDTGQSSYGVSYFGLPASTDYSQVVNTALLQADYEVSSKVTATAAWQVVQRHLVSTFEVFSINSQSTGEDRSSMIIARVRWAPLRSVQVGCDVSRERRSASGPIASPLNDNMFSCFGQFQIRP